MVRKGAKSYSTNNKERNRAQLLAIFPAVLFALLLYLNGWDRLVPVCSSWVLTICHSKMLRVFRLCGSLPFTVRCQVIDFALNHSLVETANRWNEHR